MDWNIFITGAPGSGKIYMACAFGMEACKQYYTVKYVRLIRYYKARRDSTAEAVRAAVDICIERGILRDFLLKQKGQVIAMSIYEYDEEKHLANLKQDAFEDGAASRQEEVDAANERAEAADEQVKVANQRADAAEQELARYKAKFGDLR